MRGAVFEFVIDRTAHSRTVLHRFCRIYVTNTAIAKFLSGLMGVTLIALLMFAKCSFCWIASDIVTERTSDIRITAHL